MKKLMLLIFMCILLVGTTSAFEFDNVKDYDESTKTITVTNALGLGDKIAEIQLNTPLNNLVPIGYQKVAEFEVRSNKDYNNAFKELELYNKKDNNKKFLRDFDFKVLSYENISIDDWGQVFIGNSLNGTAMYEGQIIGSHEEEREVWTKLVPADFKKNDNLTIGIFTQVEFGDHVEWIPNMFGVKIDEWAIWTASLNVGLVEYYNFDRGSGTILEGLVNGNNYTLVNTPTWQGGILGGSLLFERANSEHGVNATAIVGMDNFDNINNNITLNYWFFLNSTGAQYMSVNNGNKFTVFTDGSDLTSIITNNQDGANRWNDGNAFTTTGSWHMYTSRYNGTGDTTGGQIWIDGVKRDTSNAAFNGNWNGDKGFLNYIASQDGVTRFFDGGLDEFGIWERALTDAEVTQLYNGGVGITFVSQFPPELTLNAPADNLESFTNEIIFNATAVVDSVSLANMSFILNGVYNGTNSSVFNNTLTQFSRTLADGDYNWTVEACKTDNECVNATVRTFTIARAFINSFNFNSSTFETAQEVFIVNITTDGTTPASASLIYNGTENTGATITGLGNDFFNISKEITIPSSHGNKTFSFNFTVDGSDLSTTSQNQTVDDLTFALCNATLTTEFVNITFKDEVDLSVLNASIPTSTFEYYLGDGSITETLTYINNTDNFNYTFCSTAVNRTINVDPIIQYKQGTAYPQRIVDAVTQEYTNTTTTEVLFLLGSADGIFVTFQVINQAEQPIADVTVNGTRVIDGSEESVAAGTTSAAGSVTFWLNPDFLHTFGFAKTGFSTFITSLFPNLPTFTIQLGTVTTVVQDFTQGISYNIRPAGDYLTQNTENTFNYSLNSTFFTVEQFGISLRWGNGTIVGTNISTDNGGTVSLVANVSNETRMIMSYNYLINETFSNGTRTWTIQDTTGNEFSILRFFEDLSLYIDAGLFGFDNFGKAFLSFIILITVAGVLTTRYGIASEAAIMGIVFGIVLFLDVGIGLIPNPSFGGINRIDNFVTVFSAIMLLSILIREELR